jgi:hypothetical protein
VSEEISGEVGEETGATLEALDHVFTLLRQIALEGIDARGAREAGAALADALAAAQPPFTLQFLPEAVMRDREPLPLSLEAFRRAHHLVSAFDRLGAQELAVLAVPAVSDLCELGEALVGAANKGRSARLPEIRGLRLRALPRPKAGGTPAEEAALDQMVADQVGAVLESAEALASAITPWPWPRARVLLFELERCMLASISVTGRTLELAPGPWTTTRRSLVAAFHVGAVLARLQVSPLSQRAAMHAALAVSLHGLTERSGLSLADAVRAAWPALLDDAGDDGDVDPHRLRVCTLVRAAACAAPAKASLLVPLLHVAYEFERRRCPADAALRLSRLDLQAWLADALGVEVDAAFGRAMLGVLGLLPIGSHVLSDGRLGVVVGTSDAGDAQRPRVLVGGQIVTPAQPVELFSPLATPAR